MECVRSLGLEYGVVEILHFLDLGLKTEGDGKTCGTGISCEELAEVWLDKKVE